MVGHCKSIASLNVRGTKVTAIGIRLAIDFLPKLQFLKCIESLPVVAQIYQTGTASFSQLDDGSFQQSSQIRRLNLTDLHCLWQENSSTYLSGGLVSALKLCPFLDHLEFSKIPNITDQDLEALLNMKNLRQLTLRGLNISFDGGVVPILQKWGPKSLEILELSWLDEVDVTAIVQHCLSLCTLLLIEIKCYRTPSITSRSENQLRYLEYLALHQVKRPQTSLELSLQLLFSPSLVKANLHGLEDLSDQWIEQAAVLHGFPNLKIFYLRHCNAVTKRSIDILLALNNPLRKIIFLNCAHLSNSNRQSEWREMARKKNLEIFIMCSEPQ